MCQAGTLSWGHHPDFQFHFLSSYIKDDDKARSLYDFRIIMDRDPVLLSGFEARRLREALA